ncbi:MULTISPECIES: GNAT family N-acetyltransferase [Haloarcula]|jgi:putative acetyltransferase|uniref:GCN5-like N-acetyltransferase n=2 Tax=Haloarcula TaxID=2237 RepID=M0JLP7_9EURY|nr:MULTISPECIES: GNAT family N-acetyltransferase [Haloarcula]EMA10052.1 GCN5-like N-acetyltransferase [Haloarcula sinaiiensis ATCC 33800]EMA31011.1 GCN5-like N-acetyltransferase [Haloarcula japonica DSM 6131]QUJ74923.1 GNAT family N-acetyltransferase [Haloarcula sinaiiensis ATCC 33800]
MDVRFRDATQADVDRLCEVNRAAIEAVGNEQYNERQISAWKSGVDASLYPIGDAETHFLVAETDEHVIGFGWMKPEADEYFTVDVHGEITGMYVHPSAAGKGIGTRLLDKLERFAREASVDSLGLWASLNAVPFYKKCGYKTVTEQTLEYDDGTEVPVEEMKRMLD